ncbi:hypothetical protein [Micromonospora ureilytica]|uniref:FXSXX-COOH protein n=1 Tax=Micromonospora ureilytica TaxID=709868 RepID=A0ABS0JDB5_9ACTN|nr:hypothetical protein [Micromonospora ureilytica]MBG6064343.1 hypothetical protein [Micromonospora ureilytica]
MLKVISSDVVTDLASVHPAVLDLLGAIRTFIDAYNQRCEPFL